MPEAQHTFLFGVFLMYGFIFTIYSLSNGAIYGLESANLLIDTPETPSDNPIIYFLETTSYAMTTIFSFFLVIFTGIPTFEYWWLVPFNWAILGTSVYMFLKLLRGGG